MQDSTSRRDVIKTGGALATTVAIGALSGCSGGGGGDGNGDSGGDGGDGATGGDGSGSGDGTDGGPGGSAPFQPGLDAVPAGSTAVGDVDIQAFLNDEGLRTILSASAESNTGVTLDEQLTQVQNQQGVDPTRMRRAIGFGNSAEAMGGSGTQLSSDAYGGAILWTDFTEEEFRTIVDQNAPGTVTATSYGGNTSVLPMSESNTEYAYLGGGVVVSGTPQAVRDVIDLADGDNEPVSGEVRSVFGNTRSGPARFAFQAPEIEPPSGGGSGEMDVSGLVTEMTWLSGSILYDAGGNQKGFALDVRFTSSESASQTEQMLSEFMRFYLRQLQSDSSQESQQMAATLEKISVSRDGATARVSYEDSVENIAGSIRSGSDTMMGGGMGG